MTGKVPITERALSEVEHIDGVGESPFDPFDVSEPHKSWRQTGGFVAEALTSCFHEDLMLLLHLVERIQHASKRVREIKAGLEFEVEAGSRTAELPPEYWSLSTELENLISAFNAISLRYPSYYRLGIEGAWDGSVSGDHVGVDNDDTNFESATTPKFIAGLIELLTKDKVDLVKKCDYCGRWFIGFKKGQRFCDNSCRKSLFAKLEGTKTRRNALRRERYKLAKEQDAKHFEEIGTHKVRG